MVPCWDSLGTVRATAPTARSGAARPSCAAAATIVARPICEPSPCPAAIGRRIEVTADLERVRVFCADAVVADHERIWAKHQTISDPDHVAAAMVLRRSRFEVIGTPAHVEVEQRALSDYDTLLGLDGPVA